MPRTKLRGELLSKFSPFCASHAILNPAVLRAEVCMQNRSRFKPGGVILAPSFQFFFRIGVFLTGKDADKRRELDSVCFNPVINTMVLSAYLEN